jgi:hypothetical protein
LTPIQTTNAALFQNLRELEIALVYRPKPLLALKFLLYDKESMLMGGLFADQGWYWFERF